MPRVDSQRRHGPKGLPAEPQIGSHKKPLAGAHTDRNTEELDSSNQDRESNASSSNGSGEGDETSEGESISDSSSTGSSSPDEEANKLHDHMKDISFGALADARDAVNRAEGVPPHGLKRKRGAFEDGGHDSNSAVTTASGNDEKLQILRAHLASLRAPKGKNRKTGDEADPSNPATRRKQPNQKPKEPDRPSRTSKHAPVEQTSKRPVPRARPAIGIAASQARDPRFSSAVPHPSGGDETARKQYGFLREYANQELAELKDSLAKLPKPAKGGEAHNGLQMRRAQALREERERLRKEIERRENRARAGEKKEKEMKVKRELRSKEREEVKEGKKRNPWFAKRSVVRDLVEGKEEGGAAVDGNKQGRSGEDVRQTQKKEQRREKREARKDMKRLDGVRERRAR